MVTRTSPHCSGKTAGRRGAKVLRRKRRHIGMMVAVQALFGYVLFGVVIVSVVVALLSLRGDRHAHIGSGGLFEEESRGARSMKAPPTAAVLATERDEEMRQMLTARNERRVRKGQEPLDVEAEMRRLLSGPARTEADPALRAEVRDLVEARNARRVRQGKPPLDVESEVERQLRDVMG